MATKLFTVLFLIFAVVSLQAQNADFSTGKPDIKVPAFVDNPLLTSATWSTLATSPHAVSRSCCATIKKGDTIFVYQFGGGSSTQLTNVARYNKMTNSWQNNVSTMPQMISAGSAVRMPGDSVIYVIGGNNSPAVYGHCLKYNVITNTWTTMASIPSGMNPCTDQLTVLYRDSLIFAIGGGDGLFNTTVQYNNVRIYNTKTNTWTASTNLPMTLSMMGGGIYGDTIIVVSGTSATTYPATCYKGIINPNTLAVTWTTIANYPSGGVTRMASYFVKVGGGGGIMCTGGAIGGATVTNTAHLYNFCTRTWQTLPNNTLARSNYKGCGFGDSVVYCPGGYTTTGVGQFDKINFSQIDGNCFLVGINENNSGIPAEFKLSQNYPNPFNPTTTISYDVAKTSYVTLTVYDALGREVSVLVNGTRNAGSYIVDFDASNLSSGIYFYTLKAGDFKDTKKMLLSR